MQGQKSQKLIIGGGLAVLIVGIVVLVWPFWGLLSPARRVTVIVTGISAVGTLSLAAMTYLTLTHEELEREKPLVIDEIQSLIDPDIKTIENNLQSITDERTDTRWLYVDPASEHFGSGPQPILTQASPIAKARVMDDEPQLWDDLNEYNDRWEEISNVVNEIADESRNDVEEYVKTLNCLDEIRDRDVRILLDSAIIQLDDNGFGERTDYHELWKEHGEDIRNLVVESSEEKYEQFQALEEEFIDHSKQLRRKLLVRKVSLQSKYNISTVDLTIEEMGLNRSVM